MDTDDINEAISEMLGPWLKEREGKRSDGLWPPGPMLVANGFIDGHQWIGRVDPQPAPSLKIHDELKCMCKVDYLQVFGSTMILRLFSVRDPSIRDGCLKEMQIAMDKMWAHLGLRYEMNGDKLGITTDESPLLPLMFATVVKPTTVAETVGKVSSENSN